MKIPSSQWNAMAYGLVVCLVLLTGCGANEESEIFSSGDMSLVPIYNDNDETTTLKRLLNEAALTECLFLRIQNCQYCVYEGMAYVTHAQEERKNVVVVLVEDNRSDVKAWSAHYPELRIVSAPTRPFMQNLRGKGLPTLVTFRGEVIESAIRITVDTKLSHAHDE